MDKGVTAVEPMIVAVRLQTSYAVQTVLERQVISIEATRGVKREKDAHAC